MPTAETATGLATFERRGAGSNSERRAARWLADQLQQSGREVVIEPFWCRPNWALAHSWHVLLGVIGSLLAVHSPRVGGALILLALLSVIADALLGVSPGRRLTPERASQNVVAPASGNSGLRLIITANYDAGRTGLAYRDRLRAIASRLHLLARGRVPGWLGWIAIALGWLEAVAIARLEGSSGTPIGVAQLIPTVALVVALALLIDIASADFGPAAGDNASGVAVAVAIARALDAAPPRNAAIELVLTGAGDGWGIGLRRYLRRRQDAVTGRNAIVLGVAACAGGTPRWWASDGPLVPLRSISRLRELAATISREDAELQARPHRGRGASPTLQARIKRIPAISIGCLTAQDRAPRSHQSADVPEAVDDRALDRGVEFGLLLVDAIDAHLGQSRRREASISRQPL